MYGLSAKTSMTIKSKAMKPSDTGRRSLHKSARSSKIKIQQSVDVDDEKEVSIPIKQSAR